MSVSANFESEDDREENRDDNGSGNENESVGVGRWGDKNQKRLWFAGSPVNNKREVDFEWIQRKPKSRAIVRFRGRVKSGRLGGGVAGPVGGVTEGA
jgi:hypothetical protein